MSEQLNQRGMDGMQTNRSSNRFQQAGGFLSTKQPTPSQAGTAIQTDVIHTPAPQPLYYAPILMAPPQVDQYTPTTTSLGSSSQAAEHLKAQGFWGQLTHKVWHMVSEEAPPERPIGISQITNKTKSPTNAPVVQNPFLKSSVPRQNYRFNQPDR